MKKFMIPTAVALALSTSAYAQVSAPGIAAQAEARSVAAADLMGAQVYAATSSAAYEPGMEADWPSIGTVTGMSASGDAVIVGVGVFLGTGAKDVSIALSDLNFVVAGPDQVFVTTDLSAEVLASAPAMGAPSVVDMVVTEVEQVADAVAEGVEPATEAVSEGVAETAEIAGQTADVVAEATAEAAEVTTEIAEGTAVATETAAEQTADVVEDTVEAAASETTEVVAETEAVAEEVVEQTATAVEEVATEAETASEAVAEQTTEAASDTGAMVAAGIAAAGAALSAAGDAIATEANELTESASEAVQDVVTATQETTAEMTAPVETAVLTEAQLLNAPLFGADGSELGEISAVTAQGAVVSYGGFLGLGERQVLVSLDQLSLDADARVTTNLDEAALDALPDYQAN